MEIFSIALRAGVILEGTIFCHTSLQRLSVLGNTLVQGDNTGTVNFQYITFRNDIMVYIVPQLASRKLVIYANIHFSAVDM